MRSLAVLAHGYNVNAPDWEWVVWGKPGEGVFGRASRAMEFARKDRADMLYFGGAGSEKDGKKESEHTYKFALAHAHEVPEFMVSVPWITERPHVPAIMCPPLACIDVIAKNTREEIVNCARECTKRGIERMAVVSTPLHVLRCFDIANTLRLAGELGGVREVIAVSADTCWEGAKPGDTVIIEPPCPGRLPKHAIHESVRGVLDIRRDRITAFTKELDTLVAKYVSGEVDQHKAA